MSENQLHNLYTYLDKKFSSIDARFDAIDTRFDENELIQNEILNAIGSEISETNRILKNHEKRITELERHPA